MKAYDVVWETTVFSKRPIKVSEDDQEDTASSLKFEDSVALKKLVNKNAVAVKHVNADPVAILVMYRAFLLLFV